jgi:hypothetical protein
MIPKSAHRFSGKIMLEKCMIPGYRFADEIALENRVMPKSRHRISDKIMLGR